MLYLKAPRWFSCAAGGSPPSRFPGKALLPGSLGNLKTLNSPRKQVLPHFLPVPVLRNRPSSLGGRRVKTRPRLAGRTLGLWESKFTRTLLGQVYQTLGTARLTHLQQILGCFPAFSETFLWKTGRAGAGGKAGFKGEVLLQPEEADHMFSNRVHRPRGRGRAGSEGGGHAAIRRGGGADGNPATS